MKNWHWTVLGILLIASLILEFTYLADYASHWWNHVPAFYALWGGLGCATLIFVTKGLGKFFILSDEDYYDR
ncbi:hypothetical protein [Gracilimonas sp. BCB1]|uniref:hypothetical protein n=1 Tax=Gracilimonas sp. BCB1 TaxID=3152362 RepID=UPI0032D918FB